MLQSISEGDNPSVSSEKKEELPDSPFSDDHLNQSDGYDWSNREAEGKRRVRPPKHLRDNYLMVVEKSKSALELRKRVTSKFTLKCTWKDCNVKFKSKEGLKFHESCHIQMSDGENVSKNKSFSCPECKEEYEKWPVVRNHLWKIHKKECDLFECENCDFKSDTLYKLELHTETHCESSKQHECSCGKKFKLVSQLQNHEASHNNSRARNSVQMSDRVCPVCKKVYNCNKSLKAHLEVMYFDINCVS